MSRIGHSGNSALIELLEVEPSRTLQYQVSLSKVAIICMISTWEEAPVILYIHVIPFNIY